MANISLRIGVIALMLFIQSCGCNYHIKKVKGKCGFSSDTVYKEMIVEVPKVVTDTVFNYYSKDTVIIKEGRLTMKYYYNHFDSTVFLQGECDTVRVVKKIPVTVNKYRKVIPNWVYFFLFLLGLCFLWVVFRKNK